MFTTRTAFRSIYKDVLHIFQQSNLIHAFQFSCNATYIGRTSPLLEVRLRHYVPLGIRDRITSGHSQMLDCTICRDLNAINICAANYNDACFVVLHRDRTKEHFNVLDAIYNLFNHPSLCKQNPKHPRNLLDVSGVTWDDFIRYFIL